MALDLLVTGMWKTVGTVACGQKLFKVLRPSPTPLAGNVFEVGLLLLPLVLLLWLTINSLSKVTTTTTILTTVTTTITINTTATTMPGPYNFF